jgi:hypothetical protein
MTKQITKNIVWPGAILMAVGLMGMTTIASAYQGDPNMTGLNYSSERHEAMREAFAKKDYYAWKDLMIGKGRVTEVVNRDNFSEFVRAHELALEGELEKAQEIRRELGLGQKQHLGNGNGQGKMRGQQGHRCNY